MNEEKNTVAVESNLLHAALKAIAMLGKNAANNRCALCKHFDPHCDDDLEVEGDCPHCPKREDCLCFNCSKLDGTFANFEWKGV